MMRISETSKEIMVLDGQKALDVAANVEISIVDFSSNLADFSLNLGAGSQVKFLRIIKFDDENPGDFDLKMNLETGANLEMNVVVLGANDSVLNVLSKVQDVDSVANVNVVYFADSKKSLKIRARNDFLQKNSAGEIDIRGVVGNGSNVEIFGEIGIAQTAGGTDSQMNQHALIWGKGSKVRQLPILEINTNDVKAAHGATVSRIQEADLFYFLSRGISKSDAYNLCVNGFLNVLLGRLEFFGEHFESLIKAMEERTHKLLAG